MGEFLCSTQSLKLSNLYQYGLAAAFSKIELKSAEVTSSGNPITMDVSNHYTVKGIGKEQLINSKIEIHVSPTGKIDKVLDKWNGNIPDSAIANVSSIWQLFNPFWWVQYGEAWAFWLWSLVWWTWPWWVCYALHLDLIAQNSFVCPFK